MRAYGIPMSKELQVLDMATIAKTATNKSTRLAGRAYPRNVMERGRVRRAYRKSARQDGQRQIEDGIEAYYEELSEASS